MTRTRLVADHPAMLWTSSDSWSHAPREFKIRAFRQVPYRKATRHPWPCFLFLLPLIVAYEVGVVWLGGTHADALRNGADTWLRWALELFGVHQLYAAPVLLGLVFLIWSGLRREDCPNDLIGVCLGMAIESVAFGLGLWALSRGFGPLIESLKTQLRGSGMPHLLTFVGAGVYEELLFRLGLYSALVALCALMAPRPLGIPVAALVSASLFAAAHHVGPYGETFDERVFCFRLLAGVYFAGLYQFRGFGIAVGAHACYDVLVG